MNTNRDAITFIAAAIEGSGEVASAAVEFDIDAIASDLYDLAGSWDVAQVETAEFWQVVERHAR